MLGQDKIPILIAEKGQELIKKLVPQLTQIASRVGITNFGQSNMELPKTCLSKPELDQISELRNNLVNTLNNTSETIKTLSNPLDSLNNIVTQTSSTLNKVQTARIAANTSMALVPVPPGVPGALPALTNSLKDLTELLSPQIITAKNIISSISRTLDYVNSIIFKLINLIKIIDNYLSNCGSSNFTSYNSYILKVEHDYNQVQETPTTSEIYKGFILEIVETQYSPTVKRIKAVAKNNQNITLLQTPLSFTTIPEILIAELKLIIDSNNLKAN